MMPDSPSETPETAFGTSVAQHIWDMRYRYREKGRPRDVTLEDTWERIAAALAEAEAEAEGREKWRQRFLGTLREFCFLPGGRIQAGAGVHRAVTLFNCFVMGEIEDSLQGIFSALQEGALTMQQGGGIGYDFSTLRPHGTRARTSNAIASGPVSFMDVWDAMCAAILSTGARRGAMMGTLRCDHPDIEAFITAKLQPGRLRHFDISVLVTDAFVEAIRQDADWPLVFPVVSVEMDGETVLREWPGAAIPVPCRVMRHVSARGLWERLLRASYDSGEPGVLFIDRINRLNNLSYCERITATNPCGEVPLPPYGACNLGSVNLTRLVRRPFTPEAEIDWSGLAEIAGTAVRLLDNVIDLSLFPLPKQRDMARHSRRIGLGITGLADALIMLGLHYGSPPARVAAADIMKTICHTAYRASIALAREKGSFPALVRERYLDAPFIQTLPPDIRDGIARHGIRNSHLTAIAPAGSISLLAGNVSSGIEPVIAAQQRRTVLDAQGSPTAFCLTDHAVAAWQVAGGRSELPDAFVSAAELPVEAHIEMQATLQSYVDNAISKTVNVPENCSIAEFGKVFMLAYDKGLKGCSAFRAIQGRPTVLASR